MQRVFLFLPHDNYCCVRPLHRCAEEGDLLQLQQLLNDADADVSCVDDEGVRN